MGNADTAVSEPIDCTIHQNNTRRCLLEYGLVVITLASLVGIAANRYLKFANADSLVPVLMSTQHLTVFYWGQDRLAAVVPAMAWPIRDEIWNFRVQMIIAAVGFFGLLTMFAWFHLHTTRRRVSGATLSVVTAASGLLVMWPMRGMTGNAFVFEQVHASSLALFLLGGRWMLVGLSGRMRAFVVGGVTVFLAILMNPSAVLLSPALLVLDDEVHQRLRRFAIVCVAMLVAFASSMVAPRVLYDGPTQPAYQHFSIGRMRRGIHATASNVLASVDLSTAMVLGFACVAILAVRWRCFPNRLRITYVGAPLFGMAWLTLFSSNEWVELNIFHFRYFFPLYAAGMLLVAGSVAEAVEFVRALIEHRVNPLRIPSRWRFAIGSGCASLGVFIALGLTASADVPVLDTTGASVASARRFDVRLVVGDYWSTWPLVVAGRDAGLPLLGVTVRSDAILGEIQHSVDRSLNDRGAVRVLCTGADPDACAAEFGMYTGRAWRASPVSETGPLVVDLIPTP